MVDSEWTSTKQNPEAELSEASLSLTASPHRWLKAPVSTPNIWNLYILTLKLKKKARHVLLFLSLSNIFLELSTHNICSYLSVLQLTSTADSKIKHIQYSYFYDYFVTILKKIWTELSLIHGWMAVRGKIFMFTTCQHSRQLKNTVGLQSCLPRWFKCYTHTVQVDMSMNIYTVYLYH